MIRVVAMDGSKPQSHRMPVMVYADTEAEILGLGEVVQDDKFDDVEVIPEVGSAAITVVGGVATTYLLMPSGWQKTV